MIHEYLPYLMHPFVIHYNLRERKKRDEVLVGRRVGEFVLVLKATIEKSIFFRFFVVARVAK